MWKLLYATLIPQLENRLAVDFNSPLQIGAHQKTETLRRAATDLQANPGAATATKELIAAAKDVMLLAPKELGGDAQTIETIAATVKKEGKLSESDAVKLANSVDAIITSLHTGTAGSNQNAAIAALSGKFPKQAEGIQQALQTLKTQDRLSAGLIEQLNALADPKQTELHPDLDRGRLLLGALQDLAHPERINQGGWGTCAATCVQIALALRDPARYVELLGALGHPDPTHAGKALHIDGLKRPQDQELGTQDVSPAVASGVVSADKTRTLTTRLLSPALMNLAAGGTYLDKQDKVGADGGGLTQEQQQDLLARMGLETKLTRLPARTEPGYGRQIGNALAELDQAVKNGPVAIGLDFGSSGHGLLYAGKGVQDGHEVALLINPQGHLNSMPMADFRQRVLYTLIPTDAEAKTPFPPGADQIASYRPLSQDDYMQPMEFLESADSFKALPDNVRTRLTAAIEAGDPPGRAIVMHLVPLLAAGKLDEPTLQLLERAGQAGSAGNINVMTATLSHISLLEEQPNLKDHPLKNELLGVMIAKQVPAGPGAAADGASAIEADVSYLAQEKLLTQGFIKRLSLAGNAEEFTQTIAGARKLSESLQDVTRDVRNGLMNVMIQRRVPISDELIAGINTLKQGQGLTREFVAMLRNADDVKGLLLTHVNTLATVSENINFRRLPPEDKAHLAEQLDKSGNPAGLMTQVLALKRNELLTEGLMTALKDVGQEVLIPMLDLMNKKQIANTPENQESISCLASTHGLTNAFMGKLIEAGKGNKANEWLDVHGGNASNLLRNNTLYTKLNDESKSLLLDMVYQHSMSLYGQTLQNTSDLASKDKVTSAFLQKLGEIKDGAGIDTVLHYLNSKGLNPTPAAMRELVDHVNSGKLSLFIDAHKADNAEDTQQALEMGLLPVVEQAASSPDASKQKAPQANPSAFDVNDLFN